MWRRWIDLGGSDVNRRSELPFGVEGLSQLDCPLGVVVGPHDRFEKATEFLVGYLVGGSVHGVTSRGVVSGEGSVAGKMHASIDGGFHALDGLSGDVAAVAPALVMPAPGGNGGGKNSQTDPSDGESDRLVRVPPAKQQHPPVSQHCHGATVAYRGGSACPRLWLRYRAGSCLLLHPNRRRRSPETPCPSLS